MNFIHEHFSHRRESAFNWKLETGNLLRLETLDFYYEARDCYTLQN